MMTAKIKTEYLHGLTIKDLLMFQYRHKQYEYIEWTTYSGDKASCYTCSEFSHAPFNFKSFSAYSEAGMKARIDDMLDNIKNYEESYRLTVNATAVFYETLTYKGD
jgi:hypothetical protein